MNCRSGCRTKDHASYAECLQSANVTIAGTINSPLQSMYEDTKRDLRDYKQARADGIRPEGTSGAKIKAAMEATKFLGRPYDSQKDAPASMINSKNTAKAANLIASDA